MKKLLEAVLDLLKKEHKYCRAVWYMPNGECEKSTQLEYIVPTESLSIAGIEDFDRAVSDSFPGPLKGSICFYGQERAVPSKKDKIVLSVRRADTALFA